MSMPRVAFQMKGNFSVKYQNKHTVPLGLLFSGEHSPVHYKSMGFIHKNMKKGHISVIWPAFDYFIIVLSKFHMDFHIRHLFVWTKNWGLKVEPALAIESTPHIHSNCGWPGERRTAETPGPGGVSIELYACIYCAAVCSPAADVQPETGRLENVSTMWKTSLEFLHIHLLALPVSLCAAGI